MDGAELLISVLLVAFLLWAYARRQERITDEERARVQAEKRRRADEAPYKITAKYECALCGNPVNDADHDCHMWATAGIRPYRRTGRQRGSRYYDRWTGLVKKRDGAVFRRCYHGHVHELDALGCSRTMLRKLQTAIPPKRPSGRRGPIEGFTNAGWEAMKESTGYRCIYCNEVLASDQFHRDHMNPLSRGGRNHMDNIAPSCAECNLRKGTMTAEEYLRKQGRL